MGSLTQILKDVSGATQDEKDQKERLEMLLKLAKTKIQTYRDKLEMNFANPGTIDKIQIPGIRAIRYIEQYHVASKEGLDKQVEGHLKQAVDSFFSIGGDTSTKDAIQSGIQSLISGALSGFIGTTEVGESEDQMYVIIPENNAFIRADICCWKYHFEQAKLIDQKDTAVAYVLCKSVVDHSKITIDELIYLTTEAMVKREMVGDTHIPPADQRSLEQVISAIKDGSKSGKPNETRLLDEEDTKIRSDLKAKIPNLDSYQVTYTWTPKDANNGWWLPSLNKYSLIDGQRSSGIVPSIGEVEAYITELIRVWKKLKESMS